MPRLHHAQRSLARTKVAFREIRPDGEAARAAEIAALPTKDWKGLPVYRLECCGDFGRGPHEVWVPEYLCWGLIDLRHFLCPYH